jgi:hypothetical protein
VANERAWGQNLAFSTIRWDLFSGFVCEVQYAVTTCKGVVITGFLGVLFAMLSFVQVPQWDNDWTKCSVFVPDTACHWYVVNPDNTFGKGFSWITAPEFDVAALRDIGIQHEVTVAQGYQTTVELMNATSTIKYGDNY